MLHLAFQAVHEPNPGPKWTGLHQRFAESYRAWFLREGDAARPTYRQCRAALGTHMPELIGTYEALVDLAGGGDLAARMLSLYRPTPYLSACSQAAVNRGSPVLVRNYDYAPQLSEGTLLSSAWRGAKVMAMSDCLWGALDGMNEAGVAVSLAFGGRKVVGDGFGIPLVVRYILECAESTGDAARILKRVPVHMAYNVTVIDRAGRAQTAYLAPDRPAVVKRRPLATNHQGRVEWEDYAKVTSSPEREALLSSLLADPGLTPASLAQSFLRPPLYSTQYRQGWGTLYTALYRPREGEAEFLWPGTSYRESLANFEEWEYKATYAS